MYGDMVIASTSTIVIIITVVLSLCPIIIQYE